MSRIEIGLGRNSGHEHTLRMLGDNVTLARHSWIELVEQLREDAPDRRRILEMLRDEQPPGPYKRSAAFVVGKLLDESEILDSSQPRRNENKTLRNVRRGVVMEGMGEIGQTSSIMALRGWCRAKGLTDADTVEALNELIRQGKIERLADGRFQRVR